MEERERVGERERVRKWERVGERESGRARERVGEREREWESERESGRARERERESIVFHKVRKPTVYDFQINITFFPLEDRVFFLIKQIRLAGFSLCKSSYLGVS